jgi:transcriptional regulator with XRE-family HTH domain
MNLAAYPNLLEKLQNDEYRHAFTSSSLRRWIAMQIRELRMREGWSQKQLGEAVGKPQNVVSRLEDPSYGKVTLQTLLDFAAAFDVALIVRFGTFGELAAQIEDMSASAMAVPPFNEELALAESRAQYSGIANVEKAHRAHETVARRESLAHSSAMNEAAIANSNLNVGYKSQPLAANAANGFARQNQHSGALS